jgi:hypothetical protein
MPPTARRLDFTAITDPRWRLVARELTLALLVPRHEAVAALPRVLRTPLHLRTCHRRLAELATWLNWLTERGLTSLGEVRGEHCEACPLSTRAIACRSHPTSRASCCWGHAQALPPPPYRAPPRLAARLRL